MGEKQILICADHQDYPVAVMHTFAFRGAEYWCPYCGKAYGTFDPGIIGGEPLPSVLDRAEKYSNATRNYLGARATLAASYVHFEGKRIQPGELPAEEKKRLNDLVAQGWKLYQKLDI